MSTTTCHFSPLSTEEQALQRIARRRVGLKMGLGIHATVFAIVQLLWFSLSTLHHGVTPSHWPFWGWALALAIHATVTALRLSGVSPRERLMAAELARLRQRG